MRSAEYRLLLLLILAGLTSAAPAEDLVTGLPGVEEWPDFKQYSGYLSGTGDDKLHYWFVEAEHDSESLPLVLWLNGGPGCSSLLGLFTENGPFNAQKDGNTLSVDKYSWNKVANMLYLESPVGVGFSYSEDNDTQSDDDKTAKTNYQALQAFFKKFPEYRKNDFYIAGESYAGVYIPTLSVLVLKNTDIKFKGIAVGNGLSNRWTNTDSEIYFAYYHGLFGETQWIQLVTRCCAGDDVERCQFSVFAKNDKFCENLVDEAIYKTERSGVNIYNIYGTCAGGAPVGLRYDPMSKKATYVRPYWRIKTGRDIREEQMLNNLEKNGYSIIRTSIPCEDLSYVANYLNKKSVRKAMHIPSHVQKWQPCSDNIKYTSQPKYFNTTTLYKLLLNSEVRALVYNGDIDMVCNFLGGEWFVDDLKKPVVEERRPWYYKDTDGTKQVGGFVKQMKGITLTTIRGSGHTVPEDKPLPAFVMFSSFLANKPL